MEAKVGRGERLPPPPILPSLAQELDAYLSDSLTKVFDDVVKGDEVGFWSEDPQPQRLFRASPAPVSTRLSVKRDTVTGTMLHFYECPVESLGCTAKNSISLLRKPDPQGVHSVKGTPLHFPFRPGGFDEEDQFESLAAAGAAVPEDAHTFETVPPGFERGLNLAPVGRDGSMKSDILDIQGLDALIQPWDSDLTRLYEKERPVAASARETRETSVSTQAEDRLSSDVKDDLDLGDSVIRLKETPSVPASAEWAQAMDASMPVSDFHIQVPQMAFTWPFELDTFQKLAIVCLERNDSVFVAAHTSAGKTVIAEYAIALSQKHMTRTIYTSPIKALSNQKFRDFKDTFEDVGLVTGDIQIRPSATCLIMTTEILRSMLYNGSDIIRDLEYVIFDEVHYINDADRGVVWEEVLILLPEHVNIIMLSATVPNTLEFADWVGRTKRKKIYVISTLKRPVPLEHFLYTGSNAKTRDDLFLLQDAGGKFLTEGYNKAFNAKNASSKSAKAKNQYGPQANHNKVTPNQEKNIWITLLDHLRRKDKLPVVAFTLSTKRCDNNAELLTSLDLTTAMEKSDISHFIGKCISKLKGSDRRLPQVLKLTELLKRGIGIHHSGILPLLKEVVEMLFQRGWVKLLFATETFAMGVNMPARTVVFDNIRKFDGKQFRVLQPAEYIQMAGRAGRRGLDSTGTVIILVKNELYEMSELHGMMQGKPMALESKFKLTYSMILNLLRVEQLRVEDMMKRSFSETHHLKKTSDHRKQKAELATQLAALPDYEKSDQWREVEEFYALAQAYLAVKLSVWTLVLSHPAAVKMMSPGRVLVVNLGEEVNVPALLIAVDSLSKVKRYTVMALTQENQGSGLETVGTKPTATKEEAELLTDIQVYASLARGCSHVPGMGTGYAPTVTDVTDTSIVSVTPTSVKIDGEKIVADLKKRQIPRFKNDPPGQSTSFAVQELYKFGDASANHHWESLNLVNELKIRDIDLAADLKKMDSLNTRIRDLPCLGASDFTDRLEKIHRKTSLETQLKNVDFLLSEESLLHHPDYQNRIRVLKLLQYIDESNGTVQLKGRVACEMSCHELMMTELVFDNVLTNRPPAEIAALLSCMVFEQKTASEPELTAALKEGVEEIKRVAHTVGRAQKECGLIQPVEDFVEQFHFGLVEVVYKWALGTPFAEIIHLTDVDEGKIVRAIQRLDETLRDVKDVARVIGDPILYQKMNDASTIIKRDIVFAASLYTQ